MFKKITHADGVTSESEILFSTPFGYLFPDAARSAPCLLPPTDVTLAGLRALGRAMADNGTPADAQPALDSPIPAAFTYLGQFIDHDITARTDRDSAVTTLGKGNLIEPLDPDQVSATLRNGRRPQLDLDSVFGDGPGLAGTSTTESQVLYDDDLKLVVFEDGDRVDLVRNKTTGLDDNGDPKVTFVATVGDQRNDENINVSQLHATVARFYNAVHDDQGGSAEDKYVRARQLVRWSYQYVVVHDYLPTVCDKAVVADMLANGPRFYGGTAGQGTAFMPLEFSTAAFRFAHSMIRPFYRLSATSGDVELLKILGVNANADNFGAGDQLKKKLVIDWTNFVGATAQRARKIDTRIAHDLFTLPFRPDDPVLTSLAQSNLFRAYNLSIPTGQAVADAMGVTPLRPAEIITGEDPAIAEAVTGAYFDHRSPLWYYVLREAAVQQGGERLGAVGSRLVCETVLGLLKGDANSYLNNQHDPAVTPTGIAVSPGTPPIGDLTALLRKGGASGL